MTTDVLVLGLGSAGAAAAAACSAAGLRVVAVDARPLGEAGARWVNGVPGWVFDEVGLDRPEPPEDVGQGHRFHVVAGWGPERVTVSGQIDVDMRKLVARLQDLARARGAELRGEVRVHGFDDRGADTSAGRLDADMVVDATGMREHPREHICTAAQEVRRLADPQAASAWLARHDAHEGDTICFTGVAGGYSIVNVRVQGDEVHILTGSIPALGFPSGRKLLDGFAAEQTWVGDTLYGGSGAIPLGMPPRPIGEGRIARIGDSAGQVYATHGSGVAQQLLAADTLANQLAAGRDGSAYDVSWQRRWGAHLASADLFRRFSQTLDVTDMTSLIRAGVLSPPLVGDSMAQRPLEPPLGPLARASAGLLRTPALARRLLPTLARMKLVERHWSHYPDDPAQLPRWERHLSRLI